MTITRPIQCFKLSPLFLAFISSSSSWANTVQNLPAIELHANDDTKDKSSEQTQSYIVKNNNSAAKLNLSVKETPQTVNTITRQQIEDFNLSNTRDVLRNTPGVTVNNLETERAVYTARGFEISNILTDGVGSPASGFNYNNINPDSYFLDRVVIVKGADALTNTFGDPSATIDQIRKRPTADLQGNAAIQYGSWDTLRYEADISGPLTQDGKIRARILGFEQTGDSYLNRYELEKNGFAGVIEADLTDSTLVTLGYNQERNKPNANNWGALPLLDADGKQIQYKRSFNPNPNWAYWDYTKQNAFIELKQGLSERWNLKLSYNYLDTAHKSKLLYYYGNPQVDGSGVSLTAWGGREHLDSHVFDLQAEGKYSLFNREHEAIFGYNYIQNHQKDLQRIGTVNDPFVDNAVTTNWLGWTPQQVNWSTLNPAADYTLKINSVYAATRFHFNDDLKLLLGANFVSAKNDGLSYGSSVTFDESQLSPYVGLTYNFSPEYTGYLSYSSIFRPQTGVNVTGQALKPIDGESYEMGVKSSWFDERLTGNIAVFKTEQSNYPLRNADGNPLNRKVEVSDLSSQGAEISLAGQITDHFNLSMGYAQFSIKDKINGGDARTYNPNKTFNLLATYTVPAIPQLKLGTSVQWQDNTSLYVPRLNATIRQDAYALVNLMANYEFNPQVSLQLNVNNITNEKYLFSFPDEQAFYGAPTQYSAAVKFKY
ncbi:TonB-dependent siderophore receptor [Acinetobacter shaoyimingii]|uniref:TonB-dependent siderophore receptor n=1 Tax=Acinetobacter shaoyimingii TaxID=2715164 RepID=A0A6G8RVI3_9GAMM|nr:TonB-dependent siderophore receptor [Acinetobacter shaoyimingii]